MAVYLKSVAVLVALLGVLAGTRFMLLVANDEEYSRAALLKDRNAGNLLFESEYRVAAAGHVFLIYSAVGAFMVALIGGSALWGLGALHGKLDARFAGGPR
jgi:hypothetical protein